MKLQWSESRETFSNHFMENFIDQIKQTHPTVERKMVTE